MFRIGVAADDGRLAPDALCRAVPRLVVQGWFEELKRLVPVN
jgi:hypothetical protein